MSINVTQSDSDLLADVLWFLKGRQSACNDRNETDHIGFHHLEAIRKFRESFDSIASCVHDAQKEIADRADARINALQARIDTLQTKARSDRRKKKTRKVRS